MSNVMQPAGTGWRASWGRVQERLRRFPDDEGGDEGVNKILIIAMVALPLIIILILFGGKIKEFFQKAWTDITGKKVGTPTFSGP